MQVNPSQTGCLQWHEGKAKALAGLASGRLPPVKPTTWDLGVDTQRASRWNPARGGVRCKGNAPAPFINL
eukprot:1216863-Amphidinium_carterae.2